jgi:PKD repeat protein
MLIVTGSSLVHGAAVPLGTMPVWATSEQGIYSTGMIWRDSNRDGVIDVFFSNGNDIVQAANNVYLFGQGLLPTSASWYSANQEYSGHCAVGDIDDNGYPDLIVANYLGQDFGFPNRSDLYYNSSGLPSTSPDWQTPEEIFSFSCALGDVDNDGDLDIAFATGEGYYQDYQHCLVYRNDGGAFATTPHWMSDSVGAAMDVTWGDVDNDGDLDLAFTYDRKATAVYYNDNGGLETTPSWRAATVESGNTLVFSDINGDGWLDLIVAYNNQLGGEGRFRVYFNDGAGALNTTHGWQSQVGGYGSALALYDYDNDGDDDLATGRWFNRLWIYENLGSTLTTTPVWSNGLDIVAEELAWVDIDGLGVLPLADTLAADGARKLFYTSRHPLYEIDSVKADGVRLDYPDYCYDLVSGWLSLADAPMTEAICYYRYSFMNDLAVSNWDTVNMVFGNTTPPFVDVSADNSFGPVPLTVQFQDKSAGAYAWNWDFGDGATSTEQSPAHVYEIPGYYDVDVAVTNAERTYYRTVAGMVSAHADTLMFDSVLIVGNRARVDVNLHNYMPLSEVTIPFSWAGPLDLRCDSFSVFGVRTEGFPPPQILGFDSYNKQATIRLDAGNGPLLDPGDGSVLAIFFTNIGGSDPSPNPITFLAGGEYGPELVSYAGVYPPATVDGWVYSDCCIGRVGDVNGIDGDEPTLGDIMLLVYAKFIFGRCDGVIECLEEGDVNQSGGATPTCDDITLGDIMILVDYLFVTGPSAGLRDCL